MGSQPPPTTPQQPPSVPYGVSPPGYRLHSPAGVAWATILGTPIAGGIVLAINHWKWRQKGLATAALTGGLLTTAIIGLVAWVVPAGVPAIALLVPQIMLGYFAARWLQGRRFDAHLAAGGTRVSPGIGALIGLGTSTLLVGAVAVSYFSTGLNPRALVDSQESVDFGHGQLVFYSRGATHDDAQRLGEALVNGRYFDETTPAEVLIAGRGSGREISFVGAEGAWEDPASVEYMRDLAEYIAPDIGGRPFTVVLLDEKLYEQRRCILADNWHCAPDR